MRLAPLNEAVNNLEEEAVVAKDVVVVALVVVELRPVKFWKVEEPLTSIVAKLFAPENVLLSPKRVEDAAVVMVVQPNVPLDHRRALFAELQVDKPPEKNFVEVRFALKLLVVVD